MPKSNVWFDGDDSVEVRFTPGNPRSVEIWQFLKGPNSIASVHLDPRTAAEVCDFIRASLPELTGD